MTMSKCFFFNFHVRSLRIMKSSLPAMVCVHHNFVCRVNGTSYLLAVSFSVSELNHEIIKQPGFPTMAPRSKLERYYVKTGNQKPNGTKQKCDLYLIHFSANCPESLSLLS